MTYIVLKAPLNSHQPTFCSAVSGVTLMLPVVSDVTHSMVSVFSPV